MAFFRRWLLILMLVMLGCELSFAVGSKKEERDYAAAVGAFDDGMNERAETAFAQFVENYPASGHVAEAELLRAQAELKQGKLGDAIARLADTNNVAKAGALADEYFYWAGEAQFQGTNYPGAAEAWTALAQKFPGSRLRLRAVVETASAFAKLAEWQQTVALLETTNSVFQHAVQMDPENELVARGKLLLAQAKCGLKNFDGAAVMLEELLQSPALNPELGREAARLLYQARLAAGETEAALAATTNLLQIARLAKNDDGVAEGVALRAGALEKLGRTAEALAAYQQNLTTNAPVERQREAVLNIAQLAIAQNQFSVATNALGKFFGQFPDSPSADAALLTLGELCLKNFAAQPAATNQLSGVRAQFDLFINTFTNSPLLGKAYLDRGWCGWLAAKQAESADDLKTAAQKYSESFEDFKTAAQKIAARQLPPSADLLVAWFKMGDAQQAQKDFAGALENYHAVLDGLKLVPEADATLGDLAWYQILRASLAMNDAAGAGAAFAQISQKSPDAGLLPSSALLYGESLAGSDDARALLAKLASQISGSPLQPQVALALARTYEREQNWPAAITNYGNWLKDFPTNDLRPQVAYARAQAVFQAGEETNAFQAFTNFVAQFPASELSPLAQWWVADHFFRQPDYVNAERNYKFVFEKWPESDLAYPAQMMAGRAAVARLGYYDAIRYFSKLEQDTNCPIDLRVQATFAHGDALMRSDSTDTNNPLANFSAATNEFVQIVQLYPTNELGALALFYIGECNVQLGNYDAATNAYAQIFSTNTPVGLSAGISARSQAQVGFGIALEKQAALANGDDQRALLKLALENYLAVFDSRLAANDPFWVKKAGLQALPLAGRLGLADADRFIDHLENLFPQSRDSLEKKRAALLADKK